jgi:glycine/D-amino acid oxidase-like deaminating enzyme
LNRTAPDVIVIGGGNIGLAVAFGLSKIAVPVDLIDEGDMALRSARGNFGLVWFQGKGVGMPPYVDWCLEATRRWPYFVRELEERTGLFLNYCQPGGLEVCIDDAECAELQQGLNALRRQTTAYPYECEFIDRKALQSMIPQMELGPAVLGATYCPHDGHVNSLVLLRALHGAFQAAGGRYFPGHKVTDIRYDGRVFQVHTHNKLFSAPRLVLAAGLGITHLSKMLRMKVPVKPERGQIMVTERVLPTLPYPMGSMRQTAEGCFLFGSSNESAGFNTSVTIPVLQAIARRTLAIFPCLKDLRIVRTWAALRPLTPDGFPVYEESEEYPGAFVLTSHSGVSLASVYAEHIPRWVIGGQKPEGLNAFTSRRFHVQEN